MRDVHSDVGPELRLLLGQLMTVIDPVLQAAASFAPPGDGAPGPCQQTWCPLCAIAATASGQQHPLTAALAEHGGALLALIRTLVDSNGPGPTSNAGPTSAADDRKPSTTSKYEHISITVYE